jgi:hypothetical protein
VRPVCYIVFSRANLIFFFGGNEGAVSGAFGHLSGGLSALLRTGFRCWPLAACAFATGLSPSRPLALSGSSSRASRSNGDGGQPKCPREVGRICVAAT